MVTFAEADLADRSLRGLQSAQAVLFEALGYFATTDEAQLQQLPQHAENIRVLITAADMLLTSLAVKLAKVSKEWDMLVESGERMQE